MKYLFLVVLFALAGCASTGAGPGGAAVQSNLQGRGEAQKVSTDKPRVVCTVEQESGSHFKTRVCRKVHDIQMERERERQLQDSDEALRPAYGGG